MKPKNYLRFFFLPVVLIAIFSTCNTNTGKTGEVKNSNGRNDLWEHVGIGGGGAQFNPTISPHDPNFVFVSCDMGGSFVTYNGGELWRMFNLSRMCQFFVFDPVNPDVVYANSLGLFKSTDRGNTWNLFYPKPSEIVGLVSKGDHAGERLVTKDNTSRTVQALAIDPVQSKKMYAAIRIEQTVALYVSDNGGEDWEKEKEFEDNIKNIFINPSSPADNRTLYIVSEKGINLRENGQWQTNVVVGKDVKFNSFAGGYDAVLKKYIIYAISGESYYNTEKTSSGIYYTDDGGKTWENKQDRLVQLGGPNAVPPEYRAIGTSALHPGVVYVSYTGLKPHPDTTYSGVAKSEDFGKTWTLPWIDRRTKNEPILASNFGRDWLNERFGPWGGVPFTIGVSQNDPNLFYGSDFGRTIKTSNGGKTWESVYSKLQPGGGWTTRGMEVTTGYNVAFDPFDENHVFIALTDIGLIESVDETKSWLSATKDNGVPRPWVNTTYWITFDPEVKGRGWAVMSGTHDLPRPKMFRSKDGVTKYRGGILLTNDSGKTWEVVSSSIGEFAPTHIFFDPTSDKNSRTLYVCGFGKGVYKSTDGGITWVQKNKGIEGDEPFAWRIERRESDGTLFLVVSRRSEDGSIGNEYDGALYKSVDGAESWTKMALPEGCNGPTYLLTDVKNSDGLLLAAWGKSTSGKFTPDTGGGIFFSEDDGKTWTQVMQNDQHIHDLTFDDRNNRYYACGFNASAYYSEDDGRTWNRIKGYNFKWGKRVDLDPRDHEKIFIITFGGGTWYGPAKGDENALEDIVTPLKRL